MTTQKQSIFRIIIASIIFTVFFSVSAFATTQTIVVEPARKKKTYTATISAKDNLQIQIAVPKAKKIKFKSSKKKIAKVSKKGLVTFKKAGKTNITVTCKVGKKAIKAVIKLTAKDGTVSYSDSTGNIGNNGGNGSPSNSNPYIENSQQGSSTDYAVTSLSIDKPSLNLDVKNGWASQTIVVKVNPTPPSGNPQTVTATSSNTNVATVTSSISISTQYGAYFTVTGKNPGTSTITFKSSNGKTATANITVVNSNQVTIDGVTFDVFNFPTQITSSQYNVLSIPLAISTKSTNNFDATKLAINIANGNAKNLYPQKMKTFYDKCVQTYGHKDVNASLAEYFVPNVNNWNNAVAHVAYILTNCNTSLQRYEIDITPLKNNGSFPISIAYNGKLIRTCTVIINDHKWWNNIRTWIDPIEQEAFDLCGINNSASANRKMQAVSEWLNSTRYEMLMSQHTGSGACNIVATLRAYCANDFGLEAEYKSNQLQQTPQPAIVRGIVGAGHVGCQVYYTSTAWPTSVQQRLNTLEQQYCTNQGDNAGIPHKAPFDTNYLGPHYDPNVSYK